MADLVLIGTAITTPEVSNLQFLQQNLLRDTAAAIWSEDELYDAMGIETYPFSMYLGQISTTTLESGRSFWVPKGIGNGLAPELDILLNGTTLVSSAYSVDYLNGRVTLATGLGTATRSYLTATFYACNLWEVAAKCLAGYLNSTSVTGEKKSIKLGPLSKSVTGPSEMVRSIQERISSFKQFARAWRNESVNLRRVRL